MTRVIEKKFGKEASDLFNEATDVVKEIGDSYKEVKNNQVENICKMTAKDNAKEKAKEVVR